MDFIQRAATFFDRAQDWLADATNGTARPVLSQTEVRSLEARQAYLRQQLEHASMELGKLTYQRWTNHGVGNDGAMAVLCQQIDALNVEYQQVLGALADARAASNGARHGPYAPPAPAYQGPHGYPAAQPAPSTQSPALGPYAAHGNGAAYPPQPTHVQRANTPAPPVPMPASTSFAPDGQAQLGPVVGVLPSAPPRPPRPPKPIRECPECYTMVPGDVDFCPSCGMRV